MPSVFLPFPPLPRRLSHLVQPRIDALVLQIIKSVQASDPEYKKFNRWVLVGMQVMGTVSPLFSPIPICTNLLPPQLPTTVSSNVVMTGSSTIFSFPSEMILTFPLLAGQAGGDQAATTIEVMLGNLVGTFLTPALLQLFLSGNLAFGRPQAAGGGGTGQLYKDIIEQLGYTVFIPLFVGEVIQYLFPKKTAWVRTTFRLGKVGSFCLLLVIWCVSLSCSNRLWKPQHGHSAS
jgi:sodium/bile acid cotransporter 7